jgi:23S rRNA pseudouridine2605 synthase
MPEERLQKVLAAAGVASRRASEDLIAAGRVRVDGRRATIGQQVDPDTARIEVDGRPIGSAARTTYLLLHKPAGVTSTTRDRHAEQTVLELVPTALVPDGARLYPVGRLDQDSEGLLLLTNDGAWSERVLHPRFGVEREYALALRQPLVADQAAALERGIALEEGLATLHHLRPMTGVEVGKLVSLLSPAPPGDLAWYRATLRQGWKRQLRRMFGNVGAPVRRLVRVRIGTLRLDTLASGEVRRLSPAEVKRLSQRR